MTVENFTDPNFRSDIRTPLPRDLNWYISQVEVKDIESMFIISSGDWTDISGGSFRVSDVAARFNLPTTNNDTQRIGDDIRNKIAYLKSGGNLDTRLIAVTHDDQFGGPFTFIEGNRRSVAFASQGPLVGSMIFVGVSPAITHYSWAGKSYALDL